MYSFVQAEFLLLLNMFLLVVLFQLWIEEGDCVAWNRWSTTHGIVHRVGRAEWREAHCAEKQCHQDYWWVNAPQRKTAQKMVWVKSKKKNTVSLYKYIQFTTFLFLPFPGLTSTVSQKESAQTDAESKGRVKQCKLNGKVTNANRRTVAKLNGTEEIRWQQIACENFLFLRSI